MSELQLVDWPSGSGEVKVVQLVVGEKPYLLLGNPDLFTHGLLLMQTLRKAGIQYFTEMGKSDSEVPARSGEGYRAVGMGRATVEIDRKTADFNGRSHDYDMGIDVNHLERMAPLVRPWQLRVEGRVI